MFDEATVEQFATVLATTLVQVQAQQERIESNRHIGYQATTIEPKKVVKTASELFPIMDEVFESDNKFHVYDWGVVPHIAVPEINENYFFRKELLSHMIYHFKRKSKFGLFLTGKKGTGKSSVVEQVCARFGLPLYQETGSPTTDYFDLFGTVMLTATGKTKFMAGGLYTAMKEGGVFLLDEVDMMLPAQLVKLNEIFTKKRIFVPQTEEWVTIHGDFRIVVTGNTNGSGEVGNHTGANVLNEAFMDRFNILEVDYLLEEQEIAFVKSIVNEYASENGLIGNAAFESKREAIDDLAESMVKVARATRVGAEQTDQPVMSIRGLERWMTNYLVGNDITKAFNVAYANGLDVATREGALETLNLNLVTL